MSEINEEVALTEEVTLTEEVAPNEEEVLKAKKAKRAAIWDKVTTGILILLMASPVLILTYIFIWLALQLA
ncbi:MAG: hypothetical protein IKL79_01075 [Clostridia bacterium]|nr:hypothetical protein [Clostridia bacterium]